MVSGIYSLFKGYLGLSGKLMALGFRGFFRAAWDGHRIPTVDDNKSCITHTK